jgi:Putative DNA-binding domain
MKMPPSGGRPTRSGSGREGIDAAGDLTGRRGSDTLFPRNLDDWTFDGIRDLCDSGRSESDRHDFKLGLPDQANLTKVACASANTYGGFLVFGIADREPRRFEIIGLDPDKEFYGKFRADTKLVITKRKETSSLCFSLSVTIKRWQLKLTLAKLTVCIMAFACTPKI